MSGKLKVVLSDLHLRATTLDDQPTGVSINKGIVELLHNLRIESEQTQRDVELILNGDIFDFVQVPAVEHYERAERYPPEAYLDSSEAASLTRLKLIAQANRDVLEGLAEFMTATPPQRRVTIIKGDHDVHLFWPAIKNYLRELLDAFGERASLLQYAGEFINREQIYVAHGHQFTDATDRYPDFIDPRDPDDGSQIFYPPSLRLTANLVSDFQQRQWMLDSVKPTSTLVWYALSQDTGLAIDMVRHFVHHASAQDLWPEIEDPISRARVMECYAQDELFRRQFHYKMLHYLHLTPPPAESIINRKLAKLLPDSAMAIGQLEAEYQRKLLHEAALDLSQTAKTELIVFGHLQQPTEQTFEAGCRYINTGSWTDSLTDFSEANLSNFFSTDLIPVLQPSSFPYARVEYDEACNLISAQLLHFDPQTGLQQPASEAVATTQQKAQNWLDNLFS